MKKSIIIILAVVAILVIWAVSVYNGLVTMDENVTGQWANVETQYQRRADLIPNLVNTLIFMVMRLLVSSMRFLLPAQNIKLVTVCIFILLIIVCNVNHVELAIVKCVKILEII